MKESSPAAAGGRETVAIIGAGSIGTAFAVVHAAVDRHVIVYDIDGARTAAVPGAVEEIGAQLIEFGLLQEDRSDLAARIRVAGSLESAVANADLIHECATEALELKQTLFAEIDRCANADAVIASASSAITASAIAEGLPGRSRCLVAHPGNPPFLLRVIEIVPAPFTSHGSVDRARALLAGADMSPVLVQKEVAGFVFNRLQGALLREAYCLVRDGVASVEEIDSLVRDGLGLRWSVVGPFEAVDLNTRGGIARHAKLLGPAYAAMGAERGQNDPWADDLVDDVEAQRRALLPLDQWARRIAWRNRRLMATLAARAADGEET